MIVCNSVFVSERPVDSLRPVIRSLLLPAGNRDPASQTQCALCKYSFLEYNALNGIDLDQSICRVKIYQSNK